MIFALVPYDSSRCGCLLDLDYVARWETFDAGNGYVGDSAAEDLELINESIVMLKAWSIFKSTGRKKVLLTNLRCLV